MCKVNRAMVTEEIEPNRDSSMGSRSKERSKSPIRSLASEDSLGNSHSSGCYISDRDDDNGKWDGYQAGFDSLSKRSGSLASTATLTSNENSSSHNSYSHSHSHSSTGRSYSKSPNRSPRPGCLKKAKSDDQTSAVRAARQISSLPLASAEDDRRRDKSVRRFSGDRGSKSKDGVPIDGNGLYYQPSKASLHDAKMNLQTKKPQRIRNRSISKGPILRRKSYGEPLNLSQHTSEGSSSARGSSGKRSKSCEPQEGIKSSHGRGHSCDPPQPGTKSKKKLSPTASRNRKQPMNVTNLTRSSEEGNANVRKSWLRQENMETKDRKEQHSQKMKRKSQTSKTKSSQKKKEAKDGREEGQSGMITFLEDVVTKKGNRSNTPSPRKDRSGGLFKKSSSARSVKRASSGANSFPDRRERRSSAPAKALTAFNHSKKAMLPPEFDYDDDDGEPKPSTPLPEPPKEKILLDVSELAALEIIRLGKDNSLKLDLYDLVKHLRQEQWEKSGHNR